MRTHSDIIRDAGGPSATARAVGVSPNNSKAWYRLNSIPAPYWLAVSTVGIASLYELAKAVAREDLAIEPADRVEPLPTFPLTSPIVSAPALFDGAQSHTAAVQHTRIETVFSGQPARECEVVG